MDVLWRRLAGEPALAEALAAQRTALRQFHLRAAKIVGESCRLRPLSPGDLALKKNLFSTLFLAAERAAGLPHELMPLCGIINQCMRAWVTACDNILDDEAKETVSFDLPPGGHRFRSVLTILVVDRLTADLLGEQVALGYLRGENAQDIYRLTLQVLMPSGLQEHEEEKGMIGVLTPEQVLRQVHVRKTGLLFEAPVLVPERLGWLDLERAVAARAGLRAFGLACQILDDIVDYDSDVARRRHNYVQSLTAHKRRQGRGPTLRQAQQMAWMRAESLFSDARTHLSGMGLAFSDPVWETLLRAIAAQLGAPPGLVG